MLRDLRLNTTLHQEDVAKSIGLVKSYVSNIETGKNPIPSDAILRKWFKCLGVEEKETELLRIARTSRSRLSINHIPFDESSEDLARIIDAYENGKLSDFDRNILILVARE